MHKTVCAHLAGFLAIILRYIDAGWKRLSIFLNFLMPKLPAPKEEDLSRGMLEAIDMDSYRAEKRAVQQLQLADADATIEPLPAEGGKPEPELGLLPNLPAGCGVTALAAAGPAIPAFPDNSLLGGENSLLRCKNSLLRAREFCPQDIDLSSFLAEGRDCDREIFPATREFGAAGLRAWRWSKSGGRCRARRSRGPSWRSRP
jgi:hypothetical protein